MQTKQDQKEYGSQVERLEQLEEFAFEAYLDFIGKASRAFSLAESRADIDFETSNIETEELPGRWEQQYSVEEALGEAREAGNAFSDYYRFLNEESSEYDEAAYSSSEAVKFLGVIENFSRLDDKYREVVTSLENIEQQIAPKQEHDTPEFSFEEVPYEEVMEVEPAAQKKAVNKK